MPYIFLNDKPDRFFCSQQALTRHETADLVKKCDKNGKDARSGRPKQRMPLQPVSSSAPGLTGQILLAQPAEVLSFCCFFRLQREVPERLPPWLPACPSGSPKKEKTGTGRKVFVRFRFGSSSFGSVSRISLRKWRRTLLHRAVHSLCTCPRK